MQKFIKLIFFKRPHKGKRKGNGLWCWQEQGKIKRFQNSVVWFGSLSQFTAQHSKALSFKKILSIPKRPSGYCNITKQTDPSKSPQH